VLKESGYTVTSLILRPTQGADNVGSSESKAGLAASNREARRFLGLSNFTKQLLPLGKSALQIGALEMGTVFLHLPSNFRTKNA